MALVNEITGAVSSSCVCPSKSQSCLSVSPQTSPFLTCISDRFQVMKRSNKSGHPGHSDSGSNSYVVFCRIFQGSIHLLSVLNNISSIPLGEQSVSLLSFHLHVAQQATTPSAASMYHKETVYTRLPLCQSISKSISSCCWVLPEIYSVLLNLRKLQMLVRGRSSKISFSYAVPSIAKPSSSTCRNGRDSCKELFPENTTGLWGVLLSFSDTSSVELCYQRGSRLRCMQIQKSWGVEGVAF